MGDWRKELTAAVEKNEGKRRRPMMSFNVAIEMRVMLGAAAQQRGMSSAAYARRAVAAFIAHDLGVPFESVTKWCPSVVDPGNTTAKQAKAAATRKANGGDLRSGRRAKIELTWDDGKGYGNWRVADD